MPLVVVSRIAQLEPPHADPSVASAADIPGDSRQPSFFGQANGSFERASQRNFFDLRAIETRGARLCTQHGKIRASRFPRSIRIGRGHCECNPSCKAGFGSRLRRNEKAPIPRSFLKLAERVADEQNLCLKSEQLTPPEKTHKFNVLFQINWFAFAGQQIKMSLQCWEQSREHI